MHPLLPKRFNRTRDDFDSLEAYNDFLEEVEDISMYGTRRLLSRTPSSVHTAREIACIGRSLHYMVVS